MVKWNLLDKGMKTRLEEICYKAIKDIWDYDRNSIPEYIKIRLNEELCVIDNLKQSALFVLIYNMISDLGLTFKDYAIIQGACGNLLVSYLCGFTDFNPMDYNLSPYITYSYEGAREIYIPIFLTSESRCKAVNWLENSDLLEGVPEIKQSGGGVFLIPKGIDYKSMLTVVPNAKNGRECVCDEKSEIRNLFYELCLLEHSLSFREDIKTHKIFKACNPKTFDEKVKVWGLIHGNNIWDLAEPLLSTGKMQLKDVIVFRDDIYDYLLNYGMLEKDSSDIAHFAGKGNALRKSQSETWIKMKSIMIGANVPNWFVSYCEQIFYIFPKAHAIGTLLRTE